MMDRSHWPLDLWEILFSSTIFGEMNRLLHTEHEYVL